jgi:hypothetical protein
MEDYANLRHNIVHQSFMMFEMQYGITLNAFSKLFDPIAHYWMQKDLMNPQFLATNNEIKRRREVEAAA